MKAHVDEDIQRTAVRIRTWLVQSHRYTASTIELDEVLVREMAGVVERMGLALLMPFDTKASSKP